MADFGAEVIKVERPPHGDPYRYLSRLPGMPAAEEDYCWTIDSRSKKSLALNLADPAGREVLLKLAAAADVFLTNFQPQLVAKFRLGYDELRGVNDRLIYAYLTGHGERGPEAEHPAYDQTAYWGRSGLMDFMHYAGAEPCPSPPGLGDHPAAMALFGAIMMALFQRQKTGQGMKVTTSLMANGAWANSCFIQAAFAKAVWPERARRTKPRSPLTNHYRSRDGRRFFLCMIDPEKDWPRLCGAMRREDLIAGERFATPLARRERVEEVVALLDAEFARQDMAEWARRFAQNEVTWGPVPSTAEVIHDEQMALNGVFVEIADAPGGPRRTVSSPIAVEGIEKAPPRMAPAVGQHSLEILESLGYSREGIGRLLDSGAVFAAALQEKRTA